MNFMKIEFANFQHKNRLIQGSSKETQNRFEMRRYNCVSMKIFTGRRGTDWFVIKSHSTRSRCCLEKLWKADRAYL